MSSWEDKPFTLEHIPRKYRKAVVATVIHAIKLMEEETITFTVPEEHFLLSQRNNLQNWAFYTSRLEEELKAGVRKHGMDIWCYQNELITLFITCQYTDADRVLQKFKDHAVDAIDDESVFTVWDNDKCEMETYDGATDVGYLNKANWIQQFIKDYEDMLSLVRDKPIIRETIEQIVMKTTKFISEED
jgi:hypothetical protein